MKKVLLFFTIGLILSSCSSIINGPMQIIHFTSEPAGAKVFVDGKEIGNTPTSIPLRRIGRDYGEPSSKKSYEIVLELEGYHPYKVNITRTIDDWFWGSVLLYGVIGVIVDASNGSMYKLQPNQIIADIEKKDTAMHDKNDAIYIAVSLEIDPSWEKIGQLEAIE